MEELKKDFNSSIYRINITVNVNYALRVDLIDVCHKVARLAWARGRRERLSRTGNESHGVMSLDFH